MDLQGLIMRGLGIFIGGVALVTALKFILAMLQITVGIVWNLGILAVFICAIGYVGKEAKNYIDKK